MNEAEIPVSEEVTPSVELPIELPAEVLFEPEEAECEAEEQICTDPRLWIYRGRTIRVLRKYGRMAVEVGRLPSLLGREFFRTRVSSSRVGTFEDAVIFVHDVERALEILDEFEKKMLARMVLQDYTQDEAAVLLGCARRTVVRRFPETLDKLSEVFLKGGVLREAQNLSRRKSCQEGKTGDFSVSDSEQGE